MLDFRSAVIPTKPERLAPALELALLRRYEPVLHFTRGEQFFPFDVEPYVAQASLWYQRRGEDAVLALGRGDLTLETLGQVDTGRPDAVYFLKFAEPLDAATLKAFRQARRQLARERTEHFVAGTGRLARVGYASRFVDALFNLTLFTRGRVPGDTAAAAALTYHRLTAGDDVYQYHGRVVRSAGWIVVQYWYFYAYNNWRSEFSGANDHEGDWEMVTIYLSEREDGPSVHNGDSWTDEQLDARYRPGWVAYASHDYAGDDLRRRWDDPELEKVNGHPVVYVAAGSHASYFRRGEYLTELELAFMQPLVKVSDWLQAFWVNQLRQYQGDVEAPEDEEVHASRPFRIPFVDYARGDGIAVGEGQARQWAMPRVLDPDEGWLSSYRGLWGLYARDPFAGEDAPAGPMYNRDRTMRRAWVDPVGWAGLDKVAPPDEEVRLLVAKQVEVRDRQDELHATIQQKAFELRNLGMTLRAMRTQPHLHRLYAEYQRQVETLSDELATLRQQHASEQALLHAMDGYLVMLRAGLREPPRAHIRRALTPTADEQFRASRLAEVWAAASIGLMLVVLVGLIYFARQYVIFGLSIMIALFAFVEATFRGRVVRMVTSLTIGLAVVSALVILYEFFWSIVALFVLLVGSYLLWENLRELWT